MNRRPIKATISLVLILSFVLSIFSGCKAEGDKNHYSVLQWLDKVENTFNLLYYTETEPLVKTVNSSDNGFDVVQIAAEWGIIDPEDDLKFNGKLTKEFAADTLVRAMNCVTPVNVDISDSKKVKPLYLENVMSSVNEGIFDVKSGKFQPKKKLTIAQADSALETARYKWVNFSYGESFDRSTVKENVINLGGVMSENCPVVEGDYSVEYTGSRKFFDENGGYVDNTQKTITFRAGKTPEGLAVDSVLAMPADDVVPMNYAVVVTGITNNSDGSVTVSTRKAELEDVYDVIDIQQSGPLDFTDAIFFGPDGERLTFYDADEDAVPMDNTSGNGKAKSLGLYRPGEVETIKTAKKTTKIELGDNLTAQLSVGLDGKGGSLGIDIKGKAKDGAGSFTAEFGFEDSVKIESRLKTHWDWFKLKVDELKFTVKDTRDEKAGFDVKVKDNPGRIINNVNERGDGWNIGDWAKEGHQLRKIYGDTRKVSESFKDLKKKAESATNKKLVDVMLANGLHFVIRAELTIEGSLRVTFTQSNTVGVELIKGKFRPIDSHENSQKMDFSAKIELTIRLAFEWQLVGINVADLGVQAGIGAKASTIIYSYDKSSDALVEVCGVDGAVLPQESSIDADEVQISEMSMQLPEDDTRMNRTCTEVNVYPILKFFACSDSSVAGKLIGSINIEVLGEKQSLKKIHYEIDENGGGVVSECTTTANESYGITTGDKLTLNLDTYAIGVSDEADTGLAIVTLPKKSTIKDVSISSDNPEVLTVENLLNKTTSNVKAGLNVSVTQSGSASMWTGEYKSTLEESKEYSFNFGSWFYDELTKGANPQFALTGKKNGTANVTVTVNGESVTVPVQVGTGEEPVVSKGALVSKVGTFTLAPGETAQAEFEHIPEERAASDISFQSSDNSVATVTKGGRIKAVGNGDAVITATLHGEDKDYNTTFTVHVVS